MAEPDLKPISKGVQRMMKSKRVWMTHLFGAAAVRKRGLEQIYSSALNFAAQKAGATNEDLHAVKILFTVLKPQLSDEQILAIPIG